MLKVEEEENREEKDFFNISPFQHFQLFEKGFSTTWPDIIFD